MGHCDFRAIWGSPGRHLTRICEDGGLLVLGFPVPEFLFKGGRASTWQKKSRSSLQSVGQGHWQRGCLGGGLAAAIVCEGRGKLRVRREGRKAGSLYKAIL